MRRANNRLRALRGLLHWGHYRDRPHSRTTRSVAIDATPHRAFTAFTATLKDSRAVLSPNRNARGEYLIHLDEKTVDRLGSMRLRVAELSKKA
jgi:hypothetical protein